jgi:hypothetical protein
MDPRIAYQRSPENRGLVWNFNRVLRLARGWAAHDDSHAPTFLERCGDIFQSESPAVVLVYPRSTVIDERGRELAGLPAELRRVRAARRPAA